MASTSPGLAQR